MASTLTSVSSIGNSITAACGEPGRITLPGGGDNRDRARHPIDHETGDDDGTGERAPAAGEDRQLRQVGDGEARRDREAQGPHHRKTRRHAQPVEARQGE